ncbi:hypothetical protein DERP_001305 [Dermatophagoides pteronyssinus]|uniref:Uncharacterized protein n=1 Tax=Dermatophagoides pteronyssinus TaxID=6956 RepID=A0ABQ8JE31_DERPT|nr:hypothetical protein DERP_001305 [Dermatophagoides pteronyssinus]
MKTKPQFPFLFTILLFYLIAEDALQNQVESASISTYDRIMIPYKSLYGFPDKCSKIIEYKEVTENELREKYRNCQMNFLEKWQITMNQYYTESLNFCCFVYEVLECESKVLSECDLDYSDRNERETRRLFDKSCQPILAKNSCGKSNKNETNWFQIVGIVIAIAASVVSCILGIRFIYNRFKKSPELKLQMEAKNAYKKDKFEQLLKLELARTTYDEEVDKRDSQWIEKMTEIIIEKERSKISGLVKKLGALVGIGGNKSEPKKENGAVAYLKKQVANLFGRNPEKQKMKKLKEKIWSKINEDSKQEEFWKDFNKYSESYNQSNLTENKKMKLDEENIKKIEELARSEADLQYDDIEKDNFLRITDRKFYKKIKNKPFAERELKRMIEARQIHDEKADPFVAKIIESLNQEQVNIHHEMLRSKNFAQIEKMDQLNDWTKRLKQTRTKIRSNRPEYFAMTPVSVDNEIPMIADIEGTVKIPPNESQQVKKKGLFNWLPFRNSSNLDNNVQEKFESKTTDHEIEGTVKIPPNDSQQVEKKGMYNRLPFENSSNLDNNVQEKFESKTTDHEIEGTVKIPPNENSSNLDNNVQVKFESKTTDHKIEGTVKIILNELQQVKKKGLFNWLPFRNSSNLDNNVQEKFETKTADHEIEGTGKIPPNDSQQDKMQHEFSPIEEEVISVQKYFRDVMEQKDQNLNGLLEPSKVLYDLNDEQLINLTQLPPEPLRRKEIILYKSVNGIPIFSEIAKNSYKNDFKYPYFGLIAEEAALTKQWDIIQAQFNEKREELKPKRTKQNLFGMRNKKMMTESEKQRKLKKYEKEFKSQEKILKNKMEKAKKEMKKDLKTKQKALAKENERFGKDRKKTEKNIKEKLEKQQKNKLKEEKKLAEKLEKLKKNETKLKSKMKTDEQSNMTLKIENLNQDQNLHGSESSLKTIGKKISEPPEILPIEYRIEPLLTTEETNILHQAIIDKPINDNSELSKYKSSVLAEMLEFQRLVSLDEGKKQEALIFRDHYLVPIYKEISSDDQQSTKSEIQPILTDEERSYLTGKKINLDPENKTSTQEKYREYIINEILEIEKSKLPLTEKNHKALRDFIEIFKNRVSDMKNKPQYPISNFKHETKGTISLISEEQEDFLFFESFVKPKIYDRQVDYNVWFFNELFATRGQHFYDPSHYRFYTMNKEQNDLFLSKLLSESITYSKGLKNQQPILTTINTVITNTAENTVLPGNAQQSKYNVQPKSSNSPDTSTLTKRLKRSLNRTILSTTQMSENQFFDCTHQFQ